MRHTVPMTTQDTRDATPARRPTGRDDVQNAILDAATELFTERSPSSVSLREIARRAGVNYGLIHHYYGSKEAIVGAVFRRKSENGARLIADSPDVHDALRRIMSSPDNGATYARLLAGALAEGATSELFFQTSPAIRRLVELIETARAGSAEPGRTEPGRTEPGTPESSAAPAPAGAGRTEPGASESGGPSDSESAPREATGRESAVRGTDPRVVAAAAMTLVAGWGLYEKFFIHAAGLEDRDPQEIRAEIAGLVDRLVRDS